MGIKALNKCMMISLFLVGVAVPVSVFAEADETMTQLNTLRESLVKAFEAKDIDGMLKNTHPDVIVTWQNGEVSHGQAEIRTFIERMLIGPTSVVDEVTGNPVVEGRQIFGDQIISYGHMNDEFVLRGDKARLRFDSRFSALIVKEGDRFVLAGLHLSANAFDNPVVSGLLSRLSKLGFLVFVGGCAVGVVLTVLLQKKRSATA